MLMGMWALALFPLRADNYPEKEVKISDCRLTSSGDTLTVSFTIDPNGLEVGPQEQWEIQPLVVSGKDTCRLPMVTIAGKIRDKVNRRQAMLAGNANFPTSYYRATVSDAGRIPVVNYRQQIPARQWMYEGEWMVKQTLAGCAACRMQTRTIPLDYTPFQAKKIQAASSVP